VGGLPATWVETRDVPIGELTRFPGNPRKGNVDQIRASIRRHGQYRAIIVRDTGAKKNPLVILAGNHTYDALAAEASETARCEIITCTDAEASAINLADNRISDLGTYDDTLLAELLAGIPELDGTGYTDEDLDRLLRETDLIGNQATSFLSDIINAGTESRPEPAAGPAGDESGSEAGVSSSGLPDFVPVTWLVTVDDRTAIRQALAAAQEQWGLHTAAEALAALARDYLTQKATT
jgi:ParB-like nuclease domain